MDTKITQLKSQSLQLHNDHIQLVRRIVSTSAKKKYAIDELHSKKTQCLRDMLECHSRIMELYQSHYAKYAQIHGEPTINERMKECRNQITVLKVMLGQIKIGQKPHA